MKDGNHFELTEEWIGYAGAVVLSEILKTNTTLSKIVLKCLPKYVIQSYNENEESSKTQQL